MTLSVHGRFIVSLNMSTRSNQLLIWSGSHHQRRQYPLKIAAMQCYCFDNKDQVLFHPTKEQTSQLACAGRHRPDGRNQGAATRCRLHLLILYGKECSYSERNASVVQPSELAD